MNLRTQFTRRMARVTLWLFTIIGAINCTAFGSETEYQWRSIPLTTPAQALAGVPGGEGFQQIMSIEYALSNPQVVYMGTDTAQVWKSTDAGHSWRVASAGMDSNGACSLFVHPENADIVFAAGCLGPEVERAHLSHGRREGIFRTLDGGKNWTFMHETEFHKQQSMGSRFAADLRTLDKEKLVLFAGTQSNGLLISQDTGQTWQETDFNEGIITDVEASTAEPGLLIVSTSKGLYQYRDGLVKKIGQGLDDVPSNASLSPAAPNRVIAAVAGHGIYISNDLGVSFHKSSHGLPLAFLSTVVDVFASPVDAARLYAGTWKNRIKGPYYSENGGKNWKKAKTINAKNLTEGGGFWFPSPIAPHPQKPLIGLAASNGKTRILRTENGGETWHYSGSGFTGGRVIDIASPHPQEWYLALTDHGLWKTKDAGKTFVNITNLDIHPSSVGAVAVREKTIVVSIGGWKEKKLAISHNEGKDWQYLDKVSGRLKFVRFHPQKSNIIYASDYRSNDNGHSWILLKQKISAIFSDNADIVYGFDEITSMVVESTDMGSNWHVLAHCGGKNIGVNEIAADPKIRGRLYLGTNSGLYRVDEGKCTRMEVDSGFTRDSHGSMSIKSIAVDPLNQHTVYAGRWAPGKGVSSGIFRSVDSGLTWAPFNNGIIGSFNVWSITTDQSDEKVYIGTTYGLHVLDIKEK